MPVSLSVEHGPHAGLPRAEVLRRVRGMMTLLQLKKEEVSITLTNDTQIHFLNKTYRAKDKPTDVLAFAMREGEFAALAGDMLGDVIVSVETARRQAVLAKHDVLAEVTMLLAHGLLHLLGWDHETAKKDRAMRAETARLVEAAVALKESPKPTAKKGATVPKPPKKAAPNGLAKRPVTKKAAKKSAARAKATPQRAQTKRR